MAAHRLQHDPSFEPGARLPSRFRTRLAIGLLATAALTRLLEALLFGITPLDNVSFTLASAVLLPAVAAATQVPVLRAASTDPAVVLRGE